MRSILILAAILALTTSAEAAKAPPAHKATPAMPAAAPVWMVDKPASRLGFRATANGVGFDGQFKTWDAQIAFDPKNLKASHVMVSVAMASVITGDPTRDQMLPTADWFEVSRFGKSTFETTSIAQTGPDRYVANGVLTLHGVKRPLSLPFSLKIAGDVATMDGAATLDRMQFGPLGKGQAGGPETVAPQVAVNVKLTARKGH